MADDKELEQATAPLSFAEFLDRMKDPAAADLVRSIKNFIKTFDERKPESERDSQLVQQFLAKSEGAFRQHPVWATGPSEHQAQAIEGLEKYLMTKIYHKAFAVSALDKERDEALSVRMAALNFIKPEHLDIPGVFQDDKAWTLAMKELHKINSYKAPRDKLVCILNCCRIINNLLHVSIMSGEARGADDFLPILIYVVIHANPPQLASNLEYIQRYRMQSRMVSESSYFFTQLYSAASFIETINTNSLTMDADEFVARMVAAGVPDMQLLPASESSPQASPTKATPAHTGSVPGAQGNTAVQSRAPTVAQTAAKAATSAARLDLPGKFSRSSSLNESVRGLSLPTVPQLEQAGIPLMLDAEAEGQLQKRHPYIYATAADLRVADVEALLSAYKQLVLRYEALSLALGSKAGLAPAAAAAAPGPCAPPTFADPPPAVEGPNPFATGSGFGSVMPNPPDALRQPSPPDVLEQEIGIAPAIPRPSNDFSSGAAASQTFAASQEMLSSASLSVPIITPVLQPTLTPISSTSPPKQTEPPPEEAAAAAAAAIGSATMALMTSSGAMTAPTEPSRPSFCVESRVLSMVCPEDTQSASELRGKLQTVDHSLSTGSQPAIPEELAGHNAGGFPTMQSEPVPQLASLISEVQMPRPYMSTPFGDPPTAREVEMPKPVMPNPFSDGSSSPKTGPALSRGPSPNPFDQPASEAISLPARGLPSPFVEQENSASFPRAIASPFDDVDDPQQEPATAPPSISTQAQQVPQKEEGLPSGFGPSGETAKGNILTGFANSPFAASAADGFRDSPPEQMFEGMKMSEEKSPRMTTSGTPQDPFEDSLI